MTALLEKLSGIKDLKGILDTCVQELVEDTEAQICQIVVNNLLEPKVTLICEKEGRGFGGKTAASFPLNVSGQNLGQLNLVLSKELSESQISWLNEIVLELGRIIRQAQVNEATQKDTFAETFLIEIDNVMRYTLGVGDAIFMVVNILGKVLQVSRCLFICTGDNQTGWQCYEYWQRGEVTSSHDYHWPTADSPVVAQTLLATSPLTFFSGQENNYVLPVQEEMQLLGVQSLLSVPLKAGETSLGCVILQQCNYNRDWSEREIEMVQNVANKVAQALIKLPAEKHKREPIMHLYQRTIPKKEEGLESAKALRESLKEALGQQAIPSAHDNKVVQKKEIKIEVVEEIVKEEAKTEVQTETVSEPLQVEEQENKKVTSWGDLDAIPTPTSQPITSVKGDLAAATRASKSKVETKSALLASLQKNKKLEEKKPEEPKVEEKPPEEKKLTKKVSKKKKAPAKILPAAEGELEALVAAHPPSEPATQSGSQATSDYIFATPGLDPVVLGRINGWVSTIEEKDKYVDGHARHVATYSVAIGKAIGFSEEELFTLQQAALVHDLGKLAAAPHVLQKKDEDLSDAELITLMRHAMDGAALLESFPDLKHLAPIVRSHHEEFNGNGYPKGLAGEEIPLLARIVQLANTYHGLVSQKCYEAGMDKATAIAELEAGAGAQFDPKLVEVFVEYLKAN